MNKNILYIALTLCFSFGAGSINCSDVYGNTSGNGKNPALKKSAADENDQDEYIFGTLQNTEVYLSSNYNAGMRMAILALGWDSFYSEEGVKNTSYINNRKSLFQSYRDMGYQVMLDFGIQYPPSWIYDYANSRVKNQYGDEFSGGIGETAVNAVFNDLMREKQEQYVRDVFDALGTGFEIVRLGFMRYGELGYIQPDYNSKSNCYWAFDDIAQGKTNGIGLPTGIPVCPVPDWLPGTSSANNEDAALFIEWYVDALKNYHDWQITTIRKYFDNEMACFTRRGDYATVRLKPQSP